MVYRSGSAAIGVEPDFTGWHRKSAAFLKTQDAEWAKAGTRFGRLAGEGFKASFSSTVRDYKAVIGAKVDDRLAKTELDALTRDRHTKVKVDVDKSSVSRFRSVLGSIGGGFARTGSGLIGAIPGAGGSLAESAGSSGPAGLAAIGVAAVAATALSAELDAVASGFAAAGAGAGAFGLLALPTFKAVTGAYSSISKDTAAYNDALTKTARNTAAKKLAQDWKNLDPAQRQAVRGIQSLDSEYHKLAGQFEGPALKVFNGGLKLASELLPDVVPFANTFASSIGKFEDRIGKAASSPGFKQFLGQLHSIEGPALTSIENGVAKVVPDIGRLFTIFSGKDVGQGITLAFDAVDGAVRGVTGALNFARESWDFYSAAGRLAARYTLDAFGKIAHGAAEAFGWVPGLGGKLKQADAWLNGFKNSADSSFSTAGRSAASFAKAGARAAKPVKLNADIASLTAKLGAAKAQLRDPDLTKTRRAQIEANIAQLQRQLAAARAALNGINGKTVTTYIDTVRRSFSTPGKGGHVPLTGYASGTSFARAGLALVGENGPEVVRFRGGEQVFPNIAASLPVPSLTVPAAPRIRGGDGGGLVLKAVYDGPQNGAVRAIMRDMRFEIHSTAGGDVQAALGRGPAR